MGCLEGFFKQLKLALERKRVTLLYHLDTYRTTAFAKFYHNIDTSTRGSVGKGAPSQPDSPGNRMAQLGDHFDNLALTSTNSNLTLEQLVTATTD